MTTNGHLLRPEMKMSDLMNMDLTLSGVLERIGIPFGFGDETVSDVCSRAGVNTAGFILICSVYLSDEYVPTRELLDNIDLKDVLRYLRLSHSYYKESAAKDLSHDLDSLMAPCSDTHKMIITRFFSDYAQELSKHFEYEEKLHPGITFPSIPLSRTEKTLSARQASKQ